MKIRKHNPHNLPDRLYERKSKRATTWWVKHPDGKTSVIRSVPITATDEQVIAARNAAIFQHSIPTKPDRPIRRQDSPDSSEVSKWIAERGIVEPSAAKTEGGLPKWAHQIFANGKRRALGRKIKWTVSMSDFREIIDRSAGVCEVSGIALTLTVSGKKGPYGPSIDRINPALGYTRGNIRIVCIAMNYAMNEWGFDAFLPIAIAIAAKHQNALGIPKT